MRTAEFEADIKNGSIEIPANLRDQFPDRVRVRVSVNEPTQSPTLLDRWLASPLQIPGFQPLSREDAHER